MISLNALVAICLGYVALLFAVAFWAESRAAAGRGGWLRGPWVYTLSLSIYCTAWTFYGAVGFAVRSGLEFVTIYLGPTLMLIGWWALLRKLVRIGRAQRITSIADLVSSRFGKSKTLGVLVTLLAVVGTTPYIALQLQSVTLSIAVFSDAPGDTDPGQSALWVACGLAVFTILFGTRRLDVNERHDGIVTAIAVEAIVKLVALVAVGVFAVWHVAGGPREMLAAIDASPLATWELRPGRWMGLTILSALAFICLPRMFQVLVVENSDERHLGTASWAFPLYLLAMSLFVVPIAVSGLAVLPPGSDPDLFVLTLPLAEGAGGLSALAFLGGFSSATSMVIVASVALGTMLSNNLVLPIWLGQRMRGATVSGDVRDMVLLSRRLGIVAVLAMGYLYYRLSGGGTALAAIGLVSFVGVVQVAPALLGGIFWRGATRPGALCGVLIGFAIWTWTLFLPSFGSGAVIPANVMDAGPFGIALLRPHALFGAAGIDPVIHSLWWSLLLNAAAFVTVSLLTFPSPLERLQGAAMVTLQDAPAENARPPTSNAAGAEDLLVMAQRILGPREAHALFAAAAASQGKQGYLPDPTSDFLAALERELAGSVGAATALAMINQITGGGTVSVEELMRVADETAQVMEYSARLEARSAELRRTAGQLREANAKLRSLSVQKDAFLGQISHELRTPMTSIQAFSEILREPGTLAASDRRRFASIIHEESRRLTRLLDDLLDLNVLEAGRAELCLAPASTSAILDRAVSAAGTGEALDVRRDVPRDIGALSFVTDGDRLTQVFINVIANAAKYCDAAAPRLDIAARQVEGTLQIDFTDNGSGIPAAAHDVIFEKFARAGDVQAAGGAGLGLAICREIMARLGGAITYVPGPGGTTFRVTLPLTRSVAAAAE